MEALGYILEIQEIELPSGDATSDQQDAYDQWSVDDTKVRYYMLASMSNELQKQHENMKSSREILKNLRELYGKNSRTARYEISKELFRARMHEGIEVAAHVQKMIRLIQQLEKFEFQMDKELHVDLVLQSARFFRKSAGVSKNKGKAMVVADKGTCFHYGKDGHWKRNYQQYLPSLKANKEKKPLEGIVPIRNKWIFKRKIGADGRVETNKARLVAKGYRQKQGVDYKETFSPVAMPKSIRIMLAVTAHYNYEVWQMDVC
ncbi:hypothetical protein CRG98_007110 [Punica granatum]|uniref:Reverse transcriptase Ty1/copia-type domain-containing protein n=1 Tax=Punica granatum TaxID=22663 RepID=A0A2I0KVL5_PUNGR|nr:hypothetical protein CRG98_007110 [Punica granatum]